MQGADFCILAEEPPFDPARAQGANGLRVWVPDGDSFAERRWLSHGFQPTERDPNARGVHWERPV